MNFSRRLLEKAKEKDEEFDNMVDIAFDTSASDCHDKNYIFDDYTNGEAKTFTNFNKDQIYELFIIISEEIVKTQSRKGPKNKHTSLDLFFLVLVYLKTYPSYATLAKAFKFLQSGIQRQLERLILPIALVLEKHLIFFIGKEQQENMNIKFEEYPSVCLILDCTVQEIPKYGKDFQDPRIFYSEKHKKYCVKKELAHLPNGLCCYESSYYYGSKHDFSIFLMNLDIYKKMCAKTASEAEASYWHIIADKGYEGASNYLPCVLPKKGSCISSSERRENDKISRNRVICENYYGRLKSLWGTARNKVKNDLKFYDSIYNLCVALTNYHIHQNPLRNQDRIIFNNNKASNNIEILDIQNNSSNSIQIQKDSLQ